MCALRHSRLLPINGFRKFCSLDWPLIKSARVLVLLKHSRRCSLLRLYLISSLALGVMAVVASTKPAIIPSGAFAEAPAPLRPVAGTAQWATPSKVFERKMFSDGLLTMPDGALLNYWGFEDPLHAPGSKTLLSPMIRVNERDSVHVKLEVRDRKPKTECKARPLSAAHRDIGSVMCERFESYVYQWKPRSAGTWFYQCHTSTAHDFEMGLYGLLVVDPEPDKSGRALAYRTGPAYDVERCWVLDDIDPKWHGDDVLSTPTPCAMGALRPFDPKYFLVNGVPNTETLHHPDVAIEARAGEKVLIRLINASFSLLRVTLENFRGDIISVDGRPLDTSERPWTQWIPVQPDQPIYMATASRHDLLIDLDPAKNTFEVGSSYKIVFEFLDLARRSVRNSGAQHPAHVGRAVTTIRVV